MEKYFVLFRFDVKMECEKIKENVKNEPPAKINNSCLKIKTHVDASCNVYFTLHLVFILQPRNIAFMADVCLSVWPHVQC